MILPTIASRRSVFPVQYSGEPIAKEEVQIILEAANWAPTHKRTEPWRFKVLYSEESRKKLSVFLSETYKMRAEKFSEVTFRKYQENPLKAACIIAICMQRDPKESLPEWEEIAATAMAVQNMWLTASEMNIGAYWGSPAIISHMGDFFPLEAGERCLGFFYMGKYQEELPKGFRNTSIEEKTQWF
ncbi:MAG: nitroreductase [Flavobacteriaceae bacterium]